MLWNFPLDLPLRSWKKGCDPCLLGDDPGSGGYVAMIGSWDFARFPRLRGQKESGWNRSVDSCEPAMTSGPGFSWKHWPAFAKVLAVGKKDSLLSIYPQCGPGCTSGAIRMLGLVGEIQHLSRGSPRHCGASRGP